MAQGNQTLDDRWTFIIDDRPSEMNTAEDNHQSADENVIDVAEMLIRKYSEKRPQLTTARLPTFGPAVAGPFG